MTEFFERRRDKIAFDGPDQCWLWTGAKNNHGYGVVRARGKPRLAHREAYEAVHGADSADGLVVRHRCDVPQCVNPAHMELGTQADNNRDKTERGRARFGVTRGEAYSQSKLTEAKVRSIRREYVPGSREYGTYALARRFGVSPSHIGLIIKYAKWRHVQ